MKIHPSTTRPFKALKSIVSGHAFLRDGRLYMRVSLNGDLVRYVDLENGMEAAAAPDTLVTPVNAEITWRELEEA